MSGQPAERPRGAAVASLIAVVSATLLLEGLRLAARHDRHWQTTLSGGGVLEHRTGAGLFLLAALVAVVPALVGSLVVPAYRRYLIGAATLAVLIAAICELFVSLATEPYLTF